MFRIIDATKRDHDPDSKPISNRRYDLIDQATNYRSEQKQFNELWCDHGWAAKYFKNYNYW